MIHCCDFKPFDVWFLYDTREIRGHFAGEIKQAGFFNRILEIGKCPECKKYVITLKETRKTDGKVFCDTKVHTDLEYITRPYLSQINHTQEDLKIKKGRPCGITYFVGKELKDKVRYYRNDFRGQRELFGEFIGESSFLCKSL